MINKDIHVPAYYQLEQEIRRRIQVGEWKPGDLIPSERELCEESGLSRMTVRQSLSSLVRDGLLHREPGRGTFVAHPHIEEHVTRLSGFTQDIQTRGQRPDSNVLQLELQMAPPKVSEALNLKVGAPVILIKRLRLADETPIEIQYAYLPDEIFHDVLNENLQNRSLYEFLAEHYNLVPIRAKEQWTAILCPAEEARLLQIRMNNPVFHVYRLTFFNDQTPYEYVESFIRGDRYTLFVEPQRTVTA
jgi:GntR family transcriptional regulator